MSRTYQPVECRKCETAFTPAGSKAYYCSDECRREVKNAKALAVYHDRYASDPGFRARISEKNRNARDKARTSKMSRTPGYIYIISEEGTDFVKIGLTTQAPESRLMYLQTGNPRKLSIRQLIQVEDVFTEETHIHRVMDSCRVNGEWFKIPSV